MTVVQFTRFRLTAERERAVLAARLAALRACQGCEPALEAAYLIRLADGEWLDIAVWAGQPGDGAFNDPARAVARATFFAQIDELLGEECGVLVCPDPDAGPDAGPGFPRRTVRGGAALPDHDPQDPCHDRLGGIPVSAGSCPGQAP